MSIADEDFLRRIDVLLHNHERPKWNSLVLSMVIPTATVLLSVGGFWTLTADRIGRLEREMEKRSQENAVFHQRLATMDREMALEIERLRLKKP